MTIERMSVVWEERGAVDAMRAGLGSLIVAITAYVFMGLPVARASDIYLSRVAAGRAWHSVLLAGRYTGYRLLELSRFKALAGR